MALRGRPPKNKSTFFGEKDFVPVENVDEVLETGGAEPPAGIAAFIRRIKSAGSEAVINRVYRMSKKFGERLERKAFLGRHESYLNEEELASFYGGGSYLQQIVMQEDGEEKGFWCPRIEIEGLPKDLQEQARPGQAAGAVSGVAPMAAPGLAQHFEQLKELVILIKELRGVDSASGGGSSVNDEIKLMKAKLELENTAAVMKMERQLKFALLQSQLRELEPEEDDDDSEALAGGNMPVPVAPQKSALESAIPEWMQPFWPLIVEHFPRLIGDGPLGEMVRGVLKGSSEYQELTADPERVQELVEVLGRAFGPDKALLARKKLGL